MNVDRNNKENHWKNRGIALLMQVKKENLTEICDDSIEIAKLFEKKKKLEEDLKKMRGEIEVLEKQLNVDSTRDSNDTVSSLVKLYGSATRLTFDLESPPNEIKGLVAGKPVKTFQLDRTKLSEQEIVDFLWKLIDPETSDEMELEGT